MENNEFKTENKIKEEIVMNDNIKENINNVVEIGKTQTNNNTAETQEIEANTNYTEEIQAKINEFKTIIANKAYMFAPLTVPYDDLTVLIDKTPELELVDYFFDSISCRR